jgi:hypothetical protein
MYKFNIMLYWTPVLFILNSCVFDVDKITLKNKAGGTILVKPLSQDKLIQQSDSFETACATLKMLARNNKLPGISISDEIEVKYSDIRVHPEFRIQNALPFVPLTVFKKNDLTLFQYIFVNEDTQRKWKLSSAWMINTKEQLKELM